MNKARVHYHIAIAILMIVACSEVSSEDEIKTIFSGYHRPFRLIHASDWRDGGSRGFVLVGKGNKELMFCENQKSDSKNINKLKGRLYYGATYPTDEGAKLVQTEKARKEILQTIRKSYELDLSYFNGHIEKSKNDRESDNWKYELAITDEYLKERGF